MIRRLLVAIPLAALLAGAMTTGVAAAKPPPPPPPVKSPCPGFTALITFTLDNEKTTVTTLANGNTVVFISGVLLATVTNLSTGQSIKVNASGTGLETLYPDGSGTVTGHGHQLFYLIPPADTSEFGIPPVGLYDGNVTLTFDSSGNFTSFSYRGHVTDLCAALS
jgi:hypothetical protein